MFKNKVIQNLRSTPRPIEKLSIDTRQIAQANISPLWVFIWLIAIFINRNAVNEHEWWLSPISGERSKKPPRPESAPLRNGSFITAMWRVIKINIFFFSFLSPRTRRIYDLVVENKKQTKFCFMTINLSHSTSILKFRCSTEIPYEPFNFSSGELFFFALNKSHSAFTRASIGFCHKMISNSYE